MSGLQAAQTGLRPELGGRSEQDRCDPLLQTGKDAKQFVNDEMTQFIFLNS